MLEGLDQIAWADLNHAYGSAKDVPDLLRTLCSPDPQLRRSAHQVLHNALIEQGTIYQATSNIVPFLLEILQTDTPADKADIVMLLHQMLHGSASADFNDSSFFDDTEYLEMDEADSELQEDYLALDDDDDDADADAYNDDDNYEQQAYETILAASPTYFTLLEQDNPELQHASAKLLTHLATQDSALQQQLCNYLTQQAAPTIQTLLLISLNELIELDETWQTSLLHCFSYGPNMLVRWSAATVITGLAYEQTPPQVAQLLLDVLYNPLQLAQDYQQLAWSTDDIFLYGVQACQNLGEQYQTELIIALSASLHLAEEGFGFYLLGLLLDMLFKPEGKTRSRRKNQVLTQQQRALLNTIINSQNLWDSSDDLLILQNYRLPSKRTELAELLHKD